MPARHGPAPGKCRRSRVIMPAALSLLTSLSAKIDPRVYALVAVLAVVLTVVGAAFVVAQPRSAAATAVTLNVRDGLVEVPLDQKLVLTFSHPVTLESIDSAFHIVPASPGSIALGIDSRSATFSAAAPWVDLTDYRVSIDHFQDQAGTTVPAHTWHFRTTILPRVVSVLNDAGSPLAPGGDVAVGGKVTVVFNTAMDANAVHLTVNQKPAGVDWPAGGKSAKVATAGVPAGPILIAFLDGRDLAGHLAPGGFHIDLNLHYVNTEKTVPLKYPALVQIDNVPAARDQSGLQSADAVFEYQTEGGITRFSALFSNAPANVGPVRSGRYISFKLVRHYRGALYLSGLSLPSTRRLNADPVPVFFDAPYYRSKDRVAPENLYITGEGIQQSELAGKPNAFSVPLAAPQLPAAAPPGTDLQVPEHYSSYAYDPVTGTYSKTEENHLMADALISQPLHIAMVVVVHTREFVTGDVEDVDGAHARDFETEAGGKAEFFYRGQMAAGTWSGSDRNSPWVFKLASGELVPFPKGLTWIDVVGG